MKVHKATLCALKMLTKRKKSAYNLLSRPKYNPNLTLSAEVKPLWNQDDMSIYLSG